MNPDSLEYRAMLFSQYIGRGADPHVAYKRAVEAQDFFAAEVGKEREAAARAAATADRLKAKPE